MQLLVCTLILGGAPVLYRDAAQGLWSSEVHLILKQMRVFINWERLVSKQAVVKEG